MKRLFVLGAVLLGIALPAALPAAASAYVPLGPCILRAYTPNSGQLIGSNTFAGQGEVQCNTSHTIGINVCLQQLVTGGWQNVYCTGFSGLYYEPKISAATYSVNPVRGRWYRSWDDGTADGVEAQYTSSGVQG